MTSSFQTIVGKPRDDIPDYSVDNYESTEADLTKSVNDQITRNQGDTREFYARMATIQKELAERPLNLLGELAQFSKSAQGAMRAFEERREAQSKINEAMLYLDSNSSALRRNAEGKLNFENAKFNSDLLNENTEEAANFLRVRNAALPEDIGLEQLLANFKNNGYGARLQFINENGGQDITDIQEYVELHNAADELMVTALLMQAKELGIDTNSRKFRKAFYEKMYPDLVKRRDNNVAEFKGRANRQFKQNRDIRLNNIIKDTVSPVAWNNKTNSYDNPIDADNLVDIIYEEHGGDRNKQFKRSDALSYLIEAVAKDVGSVNPTFSIHHLEYLIETAEYSHQGQKDANGIAKKTTIENSNFRGKDGYSTLLNNVKSQLAERDLRDIRTEKTNAQGELDLFKKNNPGYDDAQLEAKLIELDKKYQKIDVRELQTGSGTVTNGGEYSSAGQPDEFLNYKDTLQSRYNPKNSVEKVYDPKKDIEVTRAYEAFKAELKNRVDQGLDANEEAVKIYDAVEAKLLAGGFKGTLIEQRKGIKADAKDIENDRQVVLADVNKAMNNGEVNSLFEQQALGDLKRHYLYGEKFPNYFNRVSEGTGINAREYALNRLKATGGLNADGSIAKPPTTEVEGTLADGVTPNIIMIDEQYGLSKKDRNYLGVKPYYGKTNSFFLNNPEEVAKVLNSVRIKGNKLGTYKTAFGRFTRNNGDELTVEQVLTFANRGADNFGIYGLDADAIKDALKGGVISKDAIFDENTQSLIVMELIRERANRTNSIQGALVQAIKGGKETVYAEDENEGNWNVLTRLNEEEKEIILTAFPALRDIPANQLQNLNQAVIKAIADGTIEAEEAAEEEKRRKLREPFLTTP